MAYNDVLGVFRHSRDAYFDYYFQRVNQYLGLHLYTVLPLKLFITKIESDTAISIGFTETKSNQLFNS